MCPIYYRHRETGECWTDLDPLASNLCVVIGSRPHLGSADDVPATYRWASEDEWSSEYSSLKRVIPITQEPN